MTDSKVQIDPYPLGAHREADGIRFSFVSGEKDCGVILYDRKTGRRLKKLPFSEQDRIGRVHYKFLQGVVPEDISYQFYEGERVVPDSRARMLTQKGTYGHRRDEKDLRACFPARDFDWEGDVCPKLPYEKCVCYLLHVRGFTRHPSSGVEHRGCFAGLTEKLPYLKKLGVTTVELQPAYEFLEVPSREEQERELPSSLPERMSPNRGELGDMEKKLSEQILPERKLPQQRLNYWGYKKGFYYAPKESYAGGADASLEFRDMIKAFHRSGMEIILQFYFPGDFPQQEIPEILRFWVINYHVDGFHLMGERLPVTMIASDAALSDTKLWYYDFDLDNIYGGSKPEYRNLASCQDDYMYEMRRFLKGDEDTLESALCHMRRNPEKEGKINYFTNYYGFTMMDMVSYDRKHNEENGEDNRDGNSVNASWNCGAEGPSRRRQIMALRRRQIRNALTMLFLSQGTPLLFMGDEFGNSQRGNNNPYCQDNEIAWLDWRNLEKNRDIMEFTASLASLRREHPILRQEKELRIMDYLSCGYPDLSYHGESAWRPCVDPYRRHIGLMYCGKYAQRDGGGEDDFFYAAVNMHWEPHEFALPRLPRDREWRLLFWTGEPEEGKTAEDCVPEVIRENAGEHCHIRHVPGRSIAVLIGQTAQATENKKSRKKKGSRIRAAAEPPEQEA